MLTRGTFLAMHVTTPPTESPRTRTLSTAAIILSAYCGSGHLTMLLSIWKITNSGYRLVMTVGTILIVLERENVGSTDLFQSYNFIINCVFWKHNLMYFGNKSQNLQGDDVFPLHSTYLISLFALSFDPLIYINGKISGGFLPPVGCVKKKGLHCLRGS